MNTEQQQRNTQSAGELDANAKGDSTIQTFSTNLTPMQRSLIRAQAGRVKQTEIAKQAKCTVEEVRQYVHTYRNDPIYIEEQRVAAEAAAKAAEERRIQEETKRKAELPW